MAAAPRFEPAALQTPPERTPHKQGGLLQALPIVLSARVICQWGYLQTECV